MDIKANEISKIVNEAFGKRLWHTPHWITPLLLLFTFSFCGSDQDTSDKGHLLTLTLSGMFFYLKKYSFVIIFQ
jgi:hypothetical protein